eukprot:TRINITY_DN47720_c0_g1_i1.p1 TRINITY_DN47720_c0_g1~~TRINITY_DN47720_c0_g1_i1.p1  ORF type:complete len:245 (+),score=21.04 TRINITY_DN47720_c0_g1_i1:12-746(+)
MQSNNFVIAMALNMPSSSTLRNSGMLQEGNPASVRPESSSCSALSGRSNCRQATAQRTEPDAVHDVPKPCASPTFPWQFMLRGEDFLQSIREARDLDQDSWSSFRHSLHVWGDRRPPSRPSSAHRRFVGTAGPRDTFQRAEDVPKRPQSARDSLMRLRRSVANQCRRQSKVGLSQHRVEAEARLENLREQQSKLISQKRREGGAPKPLVPQKPKESLASKTVPRPRPGPASRRSSPGRCQSARR